MGWTPRFGLQCGCPFAVIGNKYIIDSALPESTSFTLVDTLHGDHPVLHLLRDRRKPHIR